MMIIKKLTKYGITISFLWIAYISLTPFKGTQSNYSLTIKVENLRNSQGVVQYILYNSAENFPDQNLKTFYKKGTTEINGNRSSFTFTNLPKGEYAVHILHDENENEKTDMGFVKPREGIGFSNYERIGLTNRPKYSKAKFAVTKHDTILIKTIYL